MVRHSCESVAGAGARHGGRLRHQAAGSGVRAVDTPRDLACSATAGVRVAGSPRAPPLCVQECRLAVEGENTRSAPGKISGSTARRHRTCTGCSPSQQDAWQSRSGTSWAHGELRKHGANSVSILIVNSNIYITGVGPTSFVSPVLVRAPPGLTFVDGWRDPCRQKKSRPSWRS